MFVDSSTFPIVWLRRSEAHNENHDASFAEFEALLERKTPFVMVNDGGLGEDQPEHSQEEMRQMSLWMKRHKADLREFVKGMIVIEPNAAKRVAAKAFATVFGKFWGYPMFMAASREDVMNMASELLLEDTSA